MPLTLAISPDSLVSLSRQSRRRILIYVVDHDRGIVIIIVKEITQIDTEIGVDFDQLCVNLLYGAV
jgi:hypothetical protein